MRKTAKCTCCNNEFFIDEMVATAMPNRGGRNAYMCNECARRNRYYHTSNNEKQGIEKKNGLQVGHEWETSYNDDYARNILFEFGCIPTNDCSLHGRRTCEFVTGIQQGLNIASKMVVTIEKLVQQGHLEINESCGTHFHISINNMEDENGQKIYMNYIARFYNSLFTPLCEAMQENRTQTEQLFGRYFQFDYCRPVDMNTSASDRYNFINVTNNSNIEFRLNRFKNAKQMQKLMKMEVEMVKCIVTNFCEHFNEQPKDARRYPTITAYRKHKAQVTAKKLVKLFEKYSNN